MDDRERLFKLAALGLQTKGLATDQRYKDRFKKEFREIDQQGEHEYYIKLYEQFQKEDLVFPYNENNCLIAYLIGLCDDFYIEKPYVWFQGELPDCDIDYIDVVRDYLKNDWAPRIFGREKVCAIGTYGTLGIKSSILDMTKIYGLPKPDIQAITVSMEDKDDEGKLLEWDSACRIYPRFKEYCDNNPEIAKYAQEMIDRNKSGGVHAGGLIISSVDIAGFVPLEVRSVKKDNPSGIICSAWTEGQGSQDLMPVGFVKFDLLVISNLKQIAYACKLVKERHGLKNICALPGQRDWSDTSYLNDRAALSLANAADTKAVFQFEGHGMRNLLKRGTVTSFDDLVAYTALFRPGPLNMKMDATYCKRKRGEEEYELHPVTEPILGKTYGVMVYQEQVMDILRVVGRIPDMYTEKIRKAISKKKVAEFIKWKEVFLKNGQEVLQVGRDFVEDLWDQIEAFAEYGFNKSMTVDTLVPYPGGMKEVASFKQGEKVYCVNERGETVTTEVAAVHDHGMLDGYEVTFDDGYSLICSSAHKFLTKTGQVSLREICRTRSYILCDQQYRSGDVKCEERRVGDQMREGGQDKERDDEASPGMHRMSENGLEKKRGRDSSCSPISLWNDVSDLQGERTTSERMLRVRKNQKGTYSFQDGEVEQRQRRSYKTEGVFRDSQEDIGQTRDTSSACRESSQMAGGESREICQMYGGGLEESKTISDGDMASGAIRMAHGEDSLRRRQEASRFCEGQHLDRSGWTLPFQRIETESLAGYSTTGCNVERGSIEEGQCDADPSGYDVLQEHFGGDEGGVVDPLSVHAPITDTGRLVSRKIVRVVPVGKRHMCDLEVANPTHNFLLPNGVVTSNSHACAYSFISARLLWLKAHYPLEFYTAILMCEGDDKKFKEYRQDAKNHRVAVRPIHVNNSRENFHIHNDEIYFGFQNIKRIGEGVAKRIVDAQQYANFIDFLHRFGTDLTPVRALVALGVFNEGYDRITLRKFHEYFKETLSKHREAHRRFQVSLEDKEQNLRNLLLEEIAEDDPDFETMCQFTQEAKLKWIERFSNTQRFTERKVKGEIRRKQVSFSDMLISLASKYQDTIDKFEGKDRIFRDRPMTLDQFDPDTIKLEPEEEPLLLDEIEVQGAKGYPKAEIQYYGFQWLHELEASPDYDGYTIDRLLYEVEKREDEDDEVAEGRRAEYVGTVEVIIRKMERKVSKKNTKFEFYSLVVEDANGKQMYCTVWKDDYTRFQQEMKVGTMCKLRVKPPSGGFDSLTFEGYQKWTKEFRSRIPKNKEDDFRLIMLRPPEERKPQKTPEPESLTDLVL